MRVTHIDVHHRHVHDDACDDKEKVAAAAAGAGAGSGATSGAIGNNTSSSNSNNKPRACSCRFVLGVVSAIVTVALIFHFTGLTQLVTFRNLRKHRGTLLAFVAEHPYLSPVCYVGLYIAIVSCSLPGATVLTLSSGLLFEQPFAMLFADLGAATGACVLFSLTRLSCGASLRARVESLAAGSRVGAMIERGIQTGHIYIYMFLLRVFPVIPFWMANLVPSVMGVPFRVFALTTYVGILPGSFLYTQTGRSLAAALDRMGPTADADVFDSSAVADADAEGDVSVLSVLAASGSEIALPACLLAAWVAMLLAAKCWLERFRKND